MKEKLNHELILGLLSVGTITPFWIAWTKLAELYNAYQQKKPNKRNIRSFRN